MNAGIQLSGVVQPSPDMIYDEVYEPNEIILPKQEGRWTLFGAQPIFTKDDETIPMVREYHAGHPTPTLVQVTWLAADQIAYRFTIGKYIEQQKQLQRQAAAQAAQPQILIPQKAI